MPQNNINQYTLTGFSSVPPRSILDIKREISGSTAELTDDLQISLAQQLTVSTLECYWQALQQRYKTKLSFPSYQSDSSNIVRGSNSTSAQELGTALASLPIELAAHEIGQIYTQLLPTALRSKRGVFYTPPALAERLIENASSAGIDWGKAQIIDPACGGGILLIFAAKKVIKALGGSDPAMIARNLKTRIEGWEIDQFSSWLTRFFLEATAISITSKTGKLIGANIRTMDSLTCPEDHFSRFDLVIGNPPFGRMRLDTAVRDRYSRSLYGHANLYGMFTELAVRLAKKDGVISYLTPASFLAGGYFKNLRSLLWHEASPIHLDFVESRKGVFEGVLQETVLATYRKSSYQATANVSVISCEKEGLCLSSAGSFKLPKESSSPWILARHRKDEALVSQLQKLTSRLQDWGYKVSTGPLVWNRYKDQLSSETGSDCIPIIWSESVTQDGRFEFRSKKKNHQPYFNFNGGRDDWLKIEQECILLQRTTAKEQKRRLIAAAIPADFVNRYSCFTVENHLNMIYPIVNKPAVSLDVLSAFLNSEVADRVFRCLSGSVAVSAYELESLPLPSKEQLTKLKRLISRKATKEAIDQECWFLYGQGR